MGRLVYGSVDCRRSHMQRLSDPQLSIVDLPWVRNALLGVVNTVMMFTLVHRDCGSFPDLRASTGLVSHLVLSIELHPRRSCILFYPLHSLQVSPETLLLHLLIGINPNVLYQTALIHSFFPFFQDDHCPPSTLYHHERD